MNSKVKYLLAVFIYGTIGMILRKICFPSEIVVLARGIIGSLFIFTYMMISHKEIDRKAIKENLKWLVISGISLGLNWIFLFAAYNYTTVAIASLCNYLAPVIVILIAPIIFKSKLSFKKILCVIGALVGVYLISGFASNGDVVVNFEGIFFGLLAALCFVMIVVSNKFIKNIRPYDKALIQLIFSAITVLPYVLFNNLGKTIPFNISSLLLTIMLGLIHTGVAYIFYFDGLGALSVEEIAIFGYLEPVVSVLSSVFILSEGMDIFGWIGTFMILISAVMSELIK